MKETGDSQGMGRREVLKGLAAGAAPADARRLEMLRRAEIEAILTHYRELDLVITTPQYRLPDRADVLQNLGTLHRVTPGSLDAARAAWQPRFAELPRPPSMRAFQRLDSQVSRKTCSGGYSHQSENSAANRRIVELLRGRRFGPGGVGANVLPFVDHGQLTAALAQALQLNLQFRRLAAGGRRHRPDRSSRSGWQGGSVRETVHGQCVRVGGAGCAGAPEGRLPDGRHVDPVPADHGRGTRLDRQRAYRRAAPGSG